MQTKPQRQNTAAIEADKQKIADFLAAFNAPGYRKPIPARLTRLRMDHTYSKDPELCRHYGQGDVAEETVDGKLTSVISCKSCCTELGRIEGRLEK